MNGLTDSQNMNKSQKHYAEPKKPDSEQYILYDSIYMQLRKKI